MSNNLNICTGLRQLPTEKLPTDNCQIRQLLTRQSRSRKTAN